jgi:hypothetical protein
MKKCLNILNKTGEVENHEVSQDFYFILIIIISNITYMTLLLHHDYTVRSQLHNTTS